MREMICLLTHRQRADGTGWEKKEFPAVRDGGCVATKTFKHPLSTLTSAATSDVVRRICECLNGTAASVENEGDGATSDPNEFVMVGQDEASR